MKSKQKMSFFRILTILLLGLNGVQADWPMSNDPDFDTTVSNPAYPAADGPRILLDSAHHNFHVEWGFIDPFAELARADGYQPVKGDEEFTSDYLSTFDIAVVITALPFEFTTKTEVTTEQAFSEAEITALHEWVWAGGSLLVFTEHAPFDQAINPLLHRFGVSSSVGTIVDPIHYDKQLGSPGWIVFSRENGLLDTHHPIIQGRNEAEQIESVISFGGSALTGEGYTNLLRLSTTAENREHPTGVGPVGMGNSQGLVGDIGQGRVIILGDSNGFTAMNFNMEDGTTKSLGMNTRHHDWKQFALNTLHWLSRDLPD